MAPNAFFDLPDFRFAELLQKEPNVWDVIKNIAPYLTTLFADGKIKGNFAENVYVEEDAEIDPTARIEGPAIILKGACVGFNAFLHGNVILDNNAVVGTACEIKNSLLLNTCKLAHFNYVSDSILGNDVRLGSGAAITNKRVDRKNVFIKLPTGQKKDIGLTKFGAIIGDRTRIGANAVINPGTILGKDTLVYPTTSAFGTHSDGEKIM